MKKWIFPILFLAFFVGAIACAFNAVDADTAYKNAALTTNISGYNEKEIQKANDTERFLDEYKRTKDRWIAATVVFAVLSVLMFIGQLILGIKMYKSKHV